MIYNVFFLFRIADDKIVPSHKTFDELIVENLTSAVINNVTANDIIYKDEDAITIFGDVIFKNSIEVTGDVKSNSGKLNNIVLNDSIVEMKNKYDGKRCLYITQ